MAILERAAGRLTSDSDYQKLLVDVFVHLILVPPLIGIHVLVERMAGWINPSGRLAFIVVPGFEFLSVAPLLSAVFVMFAVALETLISVIGRVVEHALRVYRRTMSTVRHEP